MATFVEKIFSFPRLYTAKVVFLKNINGLQSLSIDPLIKDKEIIDIGCGNVSHFYNPEYAKRRIGIDTSLEIIKSANQLYPTSTHQVASAFDLPCEDKSVDIALIQFVLHHIPADQWQNVLSEAKRVARDSIVIIDHTKHDKFLPALIQQTWWSTTDGGEAYRKESDWKTVLSKANLKVLNYQRHGLLFGNICYYHLSV